MLVKSFDRPFAFSNIIENAKGQIIRSEIITG
jgi:hypothetical protein